MPSFEIRHEIGIQKSWDLKEILEISDNEIQMPTGWGMVLFHR